MSWTTDSANTSAVTNDSPAESSGLTWNDMTGTWSDAEGTWGNPRPSWVKDSANTSLVTNDSANA